MNDTERHPSPPTRSLVIPPASIQGPLDWEALFGRPGEVVLEIGSGKGKFLAEEALRNPDRCYLGIERSLPWLRKAEARLRKAGCENVLLLRADAKDALDRLVPVGSLREIHVYYPDPWPKKRHRKRRLLDPPTARRIEDVLRPGGELHVASDHEEYFEEILGALAAATHLVRLTGRATAGGATSSFAVKYLREGRAVHDAVFLRTA